MNMNELKFLKKIISPFYLPFYWITQLLNNLLLKKFYYYPDQETFVPDKSKSFFDYFKNFINFLGRKNKRIEKKAAVNINKVILPQQKKDKAEIKEVASKFA